jgi:hypothetical protein
LTKEHFFRLAISGYSNDDWTIFRWKLRYLIFCSISKNGQKFSKKRRTRLRRPSGLNPLTIILALWSLTYAQNIKSKASGQLVTVSAQLSPTLVPPLRLRDVFSSRVVVKTVWSFTCSYKTKSSFQILFSNKCYKCLLLDVSILQKNLCINFKPAKKMYKHLLSMQGWPLHVFYVNRTKYFSFQRYLLSAYFCTIKIVF